MFKSLKLRLGFVVLIGLLTLGGVLQYTYKDEIAKYKTKVQHAHVYSVFKEMRAKTGESSIITGLIIVTDMPPNAMADSQTGLVYITQSLLDKLKNDDELALVLGHEMAHLMFKHSRSSNENELLADKMGAFIMERAGYSVCKGREFMTREFKDPLGDNLDSDHPSWAYRYDQLAVPGC